MPLFSKNKDDSSADPQVRQLEKMVSNEARQDQKTLDHAIKDLSQAEKTHNSGIKAAENAQHALDKAVQKEYKTATALNKATHVHNAALTDQQNAEKTLTLKQQHEGRLEHDLQQRKATMEDLQHRKETNDQQREVKLSQIHAQAASRVGTADAPPTSRQNLDVGGNAASVGHSRGSSAAGPSV